MNKGQPDQPAADVAKILIIDDVPENLRLLMALLSSSGFKVATAIDGQTALESLKKVNPDLVLLDIMLPDMDGYEVCRRLKADPETAEIPVIFISALGESLDKVKAFDVGGIDYISKPFQDDVVLMRIQTHLDLRFTLKKLQQQKRLLEEEKAEREKTEKELSRYQDQITGLLTRQLLHPKAFSGIITRSERMQSLFQYIEALSCSSEPVLISGESGVGKELIAKAVRDVCTPDGPFVAVNIAGFDDNIFSDTLFGHVRGAFTDAKQERAGMIEKAAGGTLFLDEIGDLNLNSQIKLLRLLQEKEYLPLGSDQNRNVDCRIVVATNVDLKRKVEEKRFRSDLYYRLSTHLVNIPPLRERKEDISLLLEHFLAAAADEMGKKKPTYPVELPLLLENYSFPGNIRELRSMVYDAMSTHQSRMLSMETFKKSIDLTTNSASVQEQHDRGGEVVFPENLPTLKEMSDLLATEALRRTKGNQTMAAKLLGVSTPALNTRLKKMKTADKQV